ncbi:hypothetical protein WDW86_11005 [Bdellovibrionota bacterium FG-2]
MKTLHYKKSALSTLFTFSLCFAILSLFCAGCFDRPPAAKVLTPNTPPAAVTTDGVTPGAPGNADPHAGLNLSPAAPGGMPAGHAAGGGAPGAAKPTIDFSKISVPKASGSNGLTVSEVYAQRTKLKDKKVVVNGVVVKVNPNIMKTNWVHVRDGSGKAESKDDDLTITTNGMAAVGDKVRIEGVVHLDKDFGYGYKYATIVEEAKIEALK